MSDAPVSKLQDDDMQAAPTALMRAGVQARELARKTGTAVVIVRLLLRMRKTAPRAISPPI